MSVGAWYAAQGALCPVRLEASSRQTQRTLANGLENCVHAPAFIQLCAFSRQTPGAINYHFLGRIPSCDGDKGLETKKTPLLPAHTPQIAHIRRAPGSRGVRVWLSSSLNTSIGLASAHRAIVANCSWRRRASVAVSAFGGSGRRASSRRESSVPHPPHPPPVSLSLSLSLSLSSHGAGRGGELPALLLAVGRDGPRHESVDRPQPPAPVHLTPPHGVSCS